MRVVVNPWHIDQGAKGAFCGCPIAWALKELPDVIAAFVTPNAIHVGFGSGDSKTYKVPRSVQRFIDRFDRGRVVEPFAFRLVEK